MPVTKTTSPPFASPLVRRAAFPVVTVNDPPAAAPAFELPATAGLAVIVIGRPAVTDATCVIVALRISVPVDLLSKTCVVCVVLFTRGVSRYTPPIACVVWPGKPAVSKIFPPGFAPDPAVAAMFVFPADVLEMPLPK